MSRSQDSGDRGSQKARGRNATKVTDEKQPCAAEGVESQKCLSRNNYEKSACQMYFDNYNSCRKFWSNVSRERSAAGITPHLPPISEREGIKAKYRATGEIPTKP